MGSSQTSTVGVPAQPGQALKTQKVSFLCNTLSPFKDSFTSGCLSLSSWVSEPKCLQVLFVRACTRSHTHKHTHRNTTNTRAPTQMGVYGYTERFGGLECLKKTSDWVGASLRGSASSFLKQAERRLQRGTRERE